MVGKTETRRVVRRWPSTSTVGGDYLEDDHGQLWQEVSEIEAGAVENTTGGTVGILLPDNRIKP